MLLTYNLRIRNTDPRFHLVSCYKKHFLGLKMKNAYLWDVTVFHLYEGTVPNIYSAHVIESF